MAGFAGVAYNVNAQDPSRYHWYQLIGQTSAGYLLYTINTSRGGFLRFAGLQMMTNSVFQAVVNGAVLDECNGPCWSDKEPTHWHLDGIGSMPDPWSRRRGVQFALGGAFWLAGALIPTLLRAGSV
jgi:hypothetical protein